MICNKNEKAEKEYVFFWLYLKNYSPLRKLDASLKDYIIFLATGIFVSIGVFLGGYLVKNLQTELSVIVSLFTGAALALAYMYGTYRFYRYKNMQLGLSHISHRKNRIK